MLAAVAHPPLKIGQYFWPGLPAARIHKVDKAFAALALVRTKTDRVDARLIAQFCCERGHSSGRPPRQTNGHCTPWCCVWRHCRLCVRRRTIACRARAAVVQEIAEHVAYLEEQIKRLDKKIKQHIDENPDLRDKGKLLDSIPGIGERTIAMLLAFSVHPGRFDHARQAAAFAGLDPRQHDRAVASKASRACPKSAMLSCARRFICLPW